MYHSILRCHFLKCDKLELRNYRIYGNFQNRIRNALCLKCVVYVCKGKILSHDQIHKIWSMLEHGHPLIQVDIKHD